MKGAWIETTNAQMPRPLQSRPFTGAGIETSQLRGNDQRTPVAPVKGAWIETAHRLRILTGIAPFTGA